MVLFDPTAAVNEPSHTTSPCSDRDVVVPVPVMRTKAQPRFFPWSRCPITTTTAGAGYFVTLLVAQYRRGAIRSFSECCWAESLLCNYLDRATGVARSFSYLFGMSIASLASP